MWVNAFKNFNMKERKFIFLFLLLNKLENNRALGFFFSNTRERRKDGCVNISLIILHAGCDVNSEAKIFRIELPFTRLKPAI